MGFVMFQEGLVLAGKLGVGAVIWVLCGILPGYQSHERQ